MTYPVSDGSERVSTEVLIHNPSHYHDLPIFYPDTTTIDVNTDTNHEMKKAVLLAVAVVCTAMYELFM